MEATQRSRSPKFKSGEAKPLARIVRHVRAGGFDTRAWWIGFAATALALLLLAWLEQSVATGFRIYVLTRVLKTAWAATIALAAAALAATAMGVTIGAARETPVSRAARFVPAFVTGLAALGAMMPDWSEFSCAVAGVVVIIWAGAILVASRGSSESSND